MPPLEGEDERHRGNVRREGATVLSLGKTFSMTNWCFEIVSKSRRQTNADLGKPTAKHMPSDRITTYDEGKTP